MINYTQLLLVSSAILATSAHAATITWRVNNITDASDVYNAGTTIIAASGADGSATANVVDGTVHTTVNGVDFTDDFTMDTPTNLDTINSRAGSGLSGVYYEMLRYVDRQGTGGNDSITLSGLTSDNQYVFQIWASENGFGAAGNSGVYLDGGDAIILYEVTDGGPGQYATGTFTADSATQVISLQKYSNLATTPTTDSNLEINAYQLRVVPEPSSTALLGLGGLALILRRRK